jgi:hypothetical protein
MILRGGGCKLLAIVEGEGPPRRPTKPDNEPGARRAPNACCAGPTQP